MAHLISHSIDQKYKRFRGSPTLDGTTEFNNTSPTLSMISDSGFTVLARFRLNNDNADAQGGLCEASTTTGFWRLRVFRPGFEGTTFIDFRIDSNNASNTAFVETTPNIWHVAAGNLRPDGFGQVWLDGSTTQNLTAEIPSGTVIEPTEIVIGGHISFGPDFDGNIRDVAICYPGLTDDEIKEAQRVQDWRELPNVVRFWSLHNPYDASIRPEDDNTVPSHLREYIDGTDHMTANSISLAEWNTKEYPMSWSPIDLHPLAWYDASDTVSIEANGHNVTQWNDRSQNGFNAVPTGNPQTGIDTVSDNNVITLDGTNYFTIPNLENEFNGDTDIEQTVLGVFKFDVANTVQRAFTIESNDRAQRYPQTSLLNDAFAYNIDDDINDSETIQKNNIAIANVFSFVAVHNSSVMELFANNLSVLTENKNLEALSLDKATIAAENDGSNSVVGKVCEIVVLKRAITNDELGRWFEYVSLKWRVF